MRPDYRAATERDLAAACDLRAAMTRELSDSDPDQDDPQWRARFAEFYASRINAGTAALFLAEDGGDLIGMGAVYKLVNHRSEIFRQHAAYVTSVYVDPRYRRNGIATELARMSVEWAKAHGCVVVRLRTSSMGRPVYERMGFSPSSEMELEIE